VVAGAADGSWSDAQLGAFLMAAAIRGLDAAETRVLTRTMMESGKLWRLAAEVPGLCDKHSTGGVGDKASLVLAPLLAACGRPVVMLTGRGLGHTGGTADKLESIAGLDLDLDRSRTLAVLAEVGMAVGVATAEIAPADRRLYALRDVTATIDSLPLITASILSKKLATGAAGVVFDVKVGSGAFLPEREQARQLGELLVATARALGTPARALLTDMSQPLGRWAGHAAEVRESLDCLAGEGPEDLTALTLALAREVAELTGAPVAEGELEAALSSGAARETFGGWAAAQGARAGWEGAPELALAPVEQVVEAPAAGTVAAVATRELGLLLAEAGGGRRVPGDAIDRGVAFRFAARLGEPVAAGDELARLYLRRPDPALTARVAACFTLAGEGQSPPLIRDRIA
jgi:pyrimidine-nucleoside phosphorylase